MKAFRNKITGRLGETQFSDDADVLVRNAQSAGFTDDQISIVDITPEAYAAEIKEQNIADNPDGEKEKLIQGKIRDQAIMALKAEGKLAADGSLVKGSI